MYNRGKGGIPDGEALGTIIAVAICLTFWGLAAAAFWGLAI